MSKVLIFQLINHLLIIANCLPAVVFPEDDSLSSSFAKSEILKCLDLGDFMPATNKETQKVECYPLATNGPCDKRDEWFILPPNEVEASCRARTCPQDHVFYKVS